LDHWDRLFLRAEDLSQRPDASVLDKHQTVEQLCRIMIGREARILSLAQQTFSLEDLLNIEKRLIGTGFIGGKAVGMLLANKIISADESLDLKQHLEPHDSFYVGSDVFYTYLVENGCWKQRLEQKTKEGYFKVAPQLRERLLKGTFPDQIRDQFQEMLEYFGQSPIIVRSSSLLEDAFGNAFAGKYESVFCVSQGSPEQRYGQFEDAARNVYASTMNEEALTYRLQRGMDESDEQMALLIQRVSGSYRKRYFFPDLGGVGLSYNTFVWKPGMDPKAGMLRLAFGLGTRAVNRVEDDYVRIVALDSPLSRPLAGMDDVRKFSQHHVDLLDTKSNTLRTVSLGKLVAEDLDVDLELIAMADSEATQRAMALGKGEQKYWLLTFERLLSETKFVEIMQKILKSLESSYRYPVDIEFTVNFSADRRPIINLVQCRPLQTKGLQASVEMPTAVDSEQILFQCEGYFMGGSVSENLRRIVYVEPAGYINLSLSGKYDIARLVGKLNRRLADQQTTPTILIGPGRWGTTTPSLGIPVGFHEISNIAVLVEVAYEGGNLMPELSFGTHFFQDLVEGDILYVAIFPTKSGVTFNKDRLYELPNRLADLLPESSKYADVVRVCDLDRQNLSIIGDVVSQQLVCFFA
jgi:hypothetical protein